MLKKGGLPEWTNPCLIAEKPSQICSMSSFAMLHCIVHFPIKSNLARLWNENLEMIVTAEAMVFLCHNKICKKQLDTKFKRNNYQKIKGHLQELFQNNLWCSLWQINEIFNCPTNDCTRTLKYKRNLVKHLNSCYLVNSKRVTGF